MVVEGRYECFGNVQVPATNGAPQKNGRGSRTLCDSVKVTLLLLLGRGEQIDGVERRDDLAANHEFFQIVAVPKRLIVQEAEPKFGVIGFRFQAFDSSGIEHEPLLSNAHATAASPRKSQAPNPRFQRERDTKLELGIWDLGFPARSAGG